MIWIKNTKGKPDAMLTFALISFSVVTLNILLSTFGTVSIGGNTISFQTLDSTIMAVYLGATFSAYVSRRWTDIKYKKPADNTTTTTVIGTSVVSESQPQPISPRAPVDDDTEEIILN